MHEAYTRGRGRREGTSYCQTKGLEVAAVRLTMPEVNMRGMCSWAGCMCRKAQLNCTRHAMLPLPSCLSKLLAAHHPVPLPRPHTPSLPCAAL